MEGFALLDRSSVTTGFNAAALLKNKDTQCENGLKVSSRSRTDKGFFVESSLFRIRKRVKNRKLDLGREKSLT
ncbi:hypothetical protein INR49_030982 [Caranx melampygus]|nr:hypothetical protein INR49_030982 [Caranx melampygus]